MSGRERNAHPIRAVKRVGCKIGRERAAVLCEIVRAEANEVASYLRAWHEGERRDDDLARAVRARHHAERQVVTLGLAALAHPDDETYSDLERWAIEALRGADVAADFCCASDARLVPPIAKIARAGFLAGPPMPWWGRAAGGETYMEATP